MTDRSELSVPEDPFADLAAYVTIPRVARIVASPSAPSAVLSVQVADDDGTRFRTRLWRMDLSGDTAPRRMDTELEIADVRYGPDGSLLVLARPKGDADAEGDPPTQQVYRLSDDGAAEKITDVETGVDGFVDLGVESLLVLTTAPSRRAGFSLDSLRETRQRRADAGVRALLHDGYPVRDLHVDIDLTEPRLLEVNLATGDAVDLLPDDGPLLRGGLGVPATAVFVGGGRILVGVGTPSRTRSRNRLVLLDPSTGERRTVLDIAGMSLEPIAYSADDDLVLFTAMVLEDPETPTSSQVWVCRPDGSEARCVSTGIDEAWISEAAFHPGGGRIIVATPRDNGQPLWVVELADGATSRLTSGTGGFMNVGATADPSRVVALGISLGAPPHPVIVDLGTGESTPLASPVPTLPLPGSATIARTTVPGPDGSNEVSGWLVTPPSASPEDPAPLLVFFHGGPLGAWGLWSWGWNPWTAVRRGYAVLLPNPAMSVGFGTEHAWRGWGRWGDEPYTEMLALIDRVVDRADIDSDAVALLGCSFGGYITNWAAGHTDRFRAIVTVSGIWDLPSFASSSDMAPALRRMLTAEDLERFSPHRHAEAIRTPMLIIHGDKDYRIPVAQALAQWADLMETVPEEGDQPHRLLLFPDEHHVVAKPQNTRVWLETQLAFLDTHVRNRPWHHPELLR